MNKMMNKGVMGRGAAGGAKAASSKSSASAAPIQALQLLGRWTRMAQGHIAYGMGCSCCADFGNVQVHDMEQHILDYLDSKYRSAGSQAVCRLLAERAGYKASQAGSIAELLRAIATQADKSIPAQEQLAVLADLGRSIDSLDEIVRGG
jgi:hypothetical protein